MTEEQIELLKNALALYAFAIRQRKDDYEYNDFYVMCSALSEIIGVDVDVT